jgi:putative endonuclease
MASKPNGTLYIGVTSDLIQRVYQHKNNLVDSFSKKYQVHDLVYFELHQNMHSAIAREKQLKKWKRQWKINLIQEKNPKWLDLWNEINS